jgi:hypothetical protein
MINHPNRSKRHTPGPWTFRTLPDGRQVLEAGDNGIQLAFWDERPGIGHAATANMALVAAAPDLLAALKAALVCLDWDDAHVKETAQARAAIAKSEQH